MDAADRGTKHTCPECASKYYDMKKEKFVCPRCGANPPPPPKPSRLAPVRRLGHMTTRPY